MARMQYENWNPSHKTLAVIDQANAILENYAEQGFDLTLRQLYYQFVARGLIPNQDSEYKRLGEIVNRARMAGYIDWDSIVDRTRNLDGLSHFRDPAHVLESSLRWFHNDRWLDQPYHVEVWVEKDALAGVIEPICNEHDVNFLSCRGYTSQSEMWAGGRRLLKKIGEGKRVRILHLGDHDPSGIDMSRDIEDRLFKFLVFDHWRAKMEGSGVRAQDSVEWIRDHFGLDRLALNMDQIEQYDPPPNPAKLTDSRGRNYVDTYGDQSWELDALEPTVLADLITAGVEEYRDEGLWGKACAQEERERDLLRRASERWDDVEELLEVE